MCWMGTGGQVHSTPDIWWVEIKENLTLRKNIFFVLFIVSIIWLSWMKYVSLKTLSINRGFCLKSFLIGSARELVKKTNVLSLWKSPSFGAEQRGDGGPRSEIWIKIELCTNYNNLQRFLVCRNDTCPGAWCNYEAPGGVCPPLPSHLKVLRPCTVPTLFIPW